MQQSSSPTYYGTNSHISIEGVVYEIPCERLVKPILKYMKSVIAAPGYSEFAQNSHWGINVSLHHRQCCEDMIHVREYEYCLATRDIAKMMCFIFYLIERRIWFVPILWQLRQYVDPYKCTRGLSHISWI